jgi:uncharacterized protein (TIGR03435 family)
MLTDLFDGIAVYGNMKLMHSVIGLIVAVGVTWAQPKRLEFEVASVKWTEPGPDPRVKVGVQIDGSQVHLTQVSLKEAVRYAYGVKFYQVVGPDWLAGERFDISGKVPQGASREQVPEMVKSLLEDRFQMKAHREPKEMAVYAMVQLPGGSKMREVPADPESSGGPESAIQRAAQGGPEGVSLAFGPGSYFKFADQKIEARKVSMVNFIDVLGRFVDRPLVDETRLPGRYDLDVQLTENDYNAMLIRSAISAGVQLPPQALRFLDSADGSLGFALKPIGLKLESKKAPVEVIVVDSILKRPTEN